VLYLVGGASRAGKSFLARRLLLQQHIPYFSLDILMMGLANGYPAFGLDPDTSSLMRGELLWPIVRAMAVNILEEALVHPTYLLEGDELLPEPVAALSRAYPGRVKACFIGYSDLTPVEKLRAVRQFESDWASYWSDDQTLAFLAGEVEYSRYLQQQCAACGLAYFDSSENLTRTVDEAARYLTCPESS